MHDALDLSLVEMARAVRQKRVSAVELTSAALARADALQSTFNGFVHIDADAALAEARLCDSELAQGRPRGVLHGIPMAHKDMFYRHGRVSTCGSRIRADWVADTTAGVLQRLDAAGAIQIGTLGMTEFAYGPTGQNVFLGDAKNPWNAEHITGGSSSGPGVAVAARIVPAALGSDTGGSVRLPAAICGVTGMKTTLSRVSRAGCMPLAQSLDTIGPLTRTVADNALMLSVIAGPDALDGACSHEPVDDYVRAAATGPQAAARLRVGVPRGYFDERVEPQVARLLDAAGETYRALGARVVEVSMPDVDAINAVGLLLTWGDVISLHGRWMRDPDAGYSAQTRGRIQMALAASIQDYLDAQRSRARLLREFADSVFQHCDVVMAPVMSLATPKISDVDVAGGPRMMRILDELTRFTRPVNALGLPALALPCGFTSNGMPCGMQLIGRPFSEALLYRAGAIYENATDWLGRRPSVLA
jgi:aspartyl-tRNA(Asn)/glutamyl-tRNA(Gln) amidotransferase subunit A